MSILILENDTMCSIEWEFRQQRETPLHERNLFNDRGCRELPPLQAIVIVQMRQLVLFPPTMRASLDFYLFRFTLASTHCLSSEASNFDRS